MCSCDELLIDNLTMHDQRFLAQLTALAFSQKIIILMAITSLKKKEQTLHSHKF